MTPHFEGHKKLTQMQTGSLKRVRISGAQNNGLHGTKRCGHLFIKGLKLKIEKIVLIHSSP